MRKIFISIALLAGFIAALSAQVVIKVGDTILDSGHPLSIFDAKPTRNIPRKFQTPSV